MTEPTPEQRRDAWLGLVSDLEARLVMTKENARASRSWAERAAAGATTARPAALAKMVEYDATAWAAQRLLDSLKTLEPPAIPVDNEKGQASLLDPRCPHGTPKGWTCAGCDGPARPSRPAIAGRDIATDPRPWDGFGRENPTGGPPSTAVENPGDNVRPFPRGPGTW